MYNGLLERSLKIVEISLKIVQSANELLETKGSQQFLEKQKTKNITRTNLFHRLNNLQREGFIRGKFISPGKGTWIWWKTINFQETKNKKEGKNDV